MHGPCALKSTLYLNIRLSLIKNKVHTQNMAIGLTIYLYCGLWVSYYEWSYTRRPKYSLVSSNLSLCLTKSLPFSLRVVALFSQCSLQNYQPPFLILFSYL